MQKNEELVITNQKLEDFYRNKPLHGDAEFSSFTIKRWNSHRLVLIRGFWPLKSKHMVKREQMATELSKKGDKKSSSRRFTSSSFSTSTMVVVVFFSIGTFKMRCSKASCHLKHAEGIRYLNLRKFLILKLISQNMNCLFRFHSREPCKLREERSIGVYSSLSSKRL